LKFKSRHTGQVFQCPAENSPERTACKKRKVDLGYSFADQAKVYDFKSGKKVGREDRLFGIDGDSYIIRSGSL
jgi:hypothetical protein